MQVYVVGDIGIQEELDLKGYQHIGGPADKDHIVELKPGYALPHDHNVSQVLHCPSKYVAMRCKHLQYVFCCFSNAKSSKRIELLTVCLAALECLFAGYGDSNILSYSTYQRTDEHVDAGWCGRSWI